MNSFFMFLNRGEVLCTLLVAVLWFIMEPANGELGRGSKLF